MFPAQNDAIRASNSQPSQASPNSPDRLKTVPVLLETPSQNKHSTKPKAAFLIEKKSFELAFGQQQREELQMLADFDSPEPIEALRNLEPDSAQNVEVLFTGSGTPPIDQAALDTLPNLKAVFHAAGSVKDLATPELWKREIKIASAARANAIPLADFTFSQIIFCLKHGWQSTLALRENGLLRPEDQLVPSTAGSTVGIISLGHAGEEVVKRLRSLNVRILAYDPYVSQEVFDAVGAKCVSLEELFETSDVVSCHTPLLPDTEGMLRKEHFMSMKAGATLINTANGSIINEGDLAETLTKRPDLFAVLDVTSPRAPLPESPFLKLPNAILTPRLAGSLALECRSLGQSILRDFKRYLAGDRLKGEVRREDLDRIA